jgi:hypothetical protein
MNGLTEQKEYHLQLGFDDGFKDGLQAGFCRGYRVGVIRYRNCDFYVISFLITTSPVL